MTNNYSFAVVPSDSKYLRKGYCRTLATDIHDATKKFINLTLSTSIDWKIVEL